MYFNGCDMFLDPKDDLTGCDEKHFVVGRLRLDRDRHSGIDVKARDCAPRESE